MSIDLLPSPEQAEIVDSVCSVLAGTATSSMSERWAQYAAQGWFGLGLSEALGGVGFGLADEVLLLREVGRALAEGPLLATMLGARVAACSGDRDLAAAIIAGSTRVGWARRSSVDDVLLFDALFDADAAGYVLVVDDDGAALHDAASLSDRAELPCIDPTVRLESCRLALDHAPRAVLAGGDVARRALVLGAAVATGIAERARDASAAYACERRQFDRPIGVNQAVKHRCADMAVRCEMSLAQTLVAGLRVEAGDPTAELDARAAFVVATDAALSNARATVQIHGGIGFTTGSVAHLLVKRAHTVDRMLGGSATVASGLLDG